MLLGEDRGGHKHRHLHPFQHHLEGGPNGHLRLAVAHIAAHQAIHGARHLHVLLHLADGQELVGRLDVGEGCLQLHLPGGVGREGVAGDYLAGGIEGQQLPGQIADGATHPRLGTSPLLAAQASEAGDMVT